MLLTTASACSAIERGQGGGEIIEGRIAQMAFIEILRPGRMGDRGEPLAGEIGFCQPQTAHDAIGGHSRDDRCRQDRNQRDAGQHPNDRDDPARCSLWRLVAVADRGHRHDRPVDAVAQGIDDRLVAVRPHWPLGQPHRDAHDDKKRESERDERRQLPENRPIAGQRRHGPGVLAHRDRDPRTMRRIAEIDPREPGWRDRDRADRRVIILALETLEDVLHLRDRDEMVLASEALRSAAPQIDADAVNRTVGLDMAIRRRVVDRDLERRFLSHGETGKDEENERSREAPNESRGGQKSARGKMPSSSIKRM